jgi:hypothetical protein
MFTLVLVSLANRVNCCRVEAAVRYRQDRSNPGIGPGTGPVTGPVWAFIRGRRYRVHWVAAGVRSLDWKDTTCAQGEAEVRYAPFLYGRRRASCRKRAAVAESCGLWYVCVLNGETRGQRVPAGTSTSKG